MINLTILIILQKIYLITNLNLINTAKLNKIAILIINNNKCSKYFTNFF